MNVSVFGLGYVGSVSAASFAADGHTVIGVDVNPDKVASLNEGRSPIVEKGLDELIRDNAANGRLRATTSTAEAVRDTELSLICVGRLSTPRAMNRHSSRKSSSHWSRKLRLHSAKNGPASGSPGGSSRTIRK